MAARRRFKQVHVLEQLQLNLRAPLDVQAELNDDDQVVDLADDKTSGMGEYLRMVYDRMHSETTVLPQDLENGVV